MKFTPKIGYGTAAPLLERDRRTKKKLPTTVGNILWNVIFIMVFYHVILMLMLTLTLTLQMSTIFTINKKDNVPPVEWNVEIRFCDFWPSGVKEPGSESSKKQNGQGAKGPGSELATVLLADSLQRVKWPGSKKVRYCWEHLRTMAGPMPVCRISSMWACSTCHHQLLLPTAPSLSNPEARQPPSHEAVGSRICHQQTRLL